MRINKTLLVGLITVGALGLILYATQKNNVRRTHRIRERVADEGYETAYDILYPLKPSIFKKYRSS